MREIRGENSYARDDFDRNKSALQNYLDKRGLRSLVDERLMVEFSGQFDGLYQSHINEIRDLDDEIEKAKAMI